MTVVCRTWKNETWTRIYFSISSFHKGISALILLLALVYVDRFSECNILRKAKLGLYSFLEKKTKLFSKLVLANKDRKSRKYLLTLIPLQALTRTMLCLISAILLPNSPPQWTPNTFYSTFGEFNPKRQLIQKVVGGRIQKRKTTI